MSEPKAERLIHWEHAAAGVCTRRDDDADAETFVQENGTRITSTARAFHAANVTCPTCIANPSFQEAKAREDAYWAQEEAEAQEWFDWVDSKEGQAWQQSLAEDPR